MARNNMTATATADNALSRRALLIGLGSASAAVAVAVAPEAHALPAITAAPGSIENPQIFVAYDRLRQAHAELVDAKTALEWLADEWKHRWPLAPEEILGIPRAEGRLGMIEGKAERDIIGRPIMRDTADVSEWRALARALPVTCFSVETSKDLEAQLARLNSRPPKGRTEASLARNTQRHEAQLAEVQRAIPMAKHYEAETARLRTEAGVPQAERRIEAAKERIHAIADDIAAAEVFTLQGIKIKAQALSLIHPALFDLFGPEVGGSLGLMTRIMRDTLTVAEELA